MPVATTLRRRRTPARSSRARSSSASRPAATRRLTRSTRSRVRAPSSIRVGGTPVLVLLAEDGKSVRVFERTVEGRALEFFLKPGASPLRSSTRRPAASGTSPARPPRRRSPASQLRQHPRPQGLLVRLEDVPPRHGRLPARRTLKSATDLPRSSTGRQRYLRLPHRESTRLPARRRASLC